MFSCDERKDKLSRMRRVRSLISMYETMKSMFESMEEVEFEDVKRYLTRVIKSLESDQKMPCAPKEFTWKPHNLN